MTSRCLMLSGWMAVLGAVSVGAEVKPLEKNLVPNPGFEEVRTTDDGVKHPSRWGALCVKEDAHAGKYSVFCRAEEGSGAPYCDAYSECFSIAPQKRYRYSGWAKGDSCAVFFRMFNEKDQIVDCPYWRLPPTTQWKPFSIIVEPNAKAVAACLILRASVGREAYFDDIGVFETEEKPPKEESKSGQPAYDKDINQTYDRLAMTFETPHIRWARPYAGGKLRAFVIAPAWAQRDTVELQQRMDLDAIPLMAFNNTALTGNTYLGVGARRVLDDLDKRLNGAYDLLIVGGMAWAAFPEDIQKRILERVKEGAGLVYTLPDAGALQFFEKTMTPEKEGQTFLTGAPGLRSTDKPFSEIVITGRLGKGRIALLPYGAPNWDSSLTPSVFFGDSILFSYECFMSILVKTCLWAAGKDTQVSFEQPAPVKIEREIMAGTNLAFRVQNNAKPMESSVCFSLRDEENCEILAKESRQSLSQGKNELMFPLPMLSEGRYMAHVWIKRPNGKILNWASIPVDVVASLSIASVETEKEAWTEGETLRGKVRLTKPLPPGMRLNVELWDSRGRLINCQNLTPVATNAEVSFPLIRPLGVRHILKAIVSDDRGMVAARQVTLAVHPAKMEEDYSFFGWFHIMGSYLNRTALSAMAQYGLDGIYDAAAWWESATPNANCTRQRVMAATGANLGYSSCGWWVCPGRNPGSVVQKDGLPMAVEPLTDAQYRKKYRDKVQLIAAIAGQYNRPFINALGDESCLELGAQDIDFSPSCVEDFRVWAEKKYGTLESANQIWKTQFASWNDVCPQRLLEARKTGDYARWIDHRLHMENVFTEAIRLGADATQEVAPNCKVGFEGMIPLEYPQSFVGYNWFDLMKFMDFVGPYEWVQGRMMLSFARPGTIFSTWTGSYEGAQETSVRANPWQLLFYGGSSLWWWTMWGGCHGNAGAAGLAPDLTPMPWLTHTLEEVKEIKQGVGKLLLRSTPVLDPILIHYSTLCIHASTIDRSTSAWVPSLQSFCAVLSDLGYAQYRFIAREQIEQDKLAQNPAKVLILPYSQILTPAEVEQIKAWVRNGGLLIADLMPGVMDENGRRLAQGRLAELFPTPTEASRQAFGKGQAVLIGPLLRNYISTKEPDGPPIPGAVASQGENRHERQLMTEVLELAGLRPQLRLESADDRLIQNVERFGFRNGNALLYGILPNPSNFTESRRVKVGFPVKGYLYDLREKKYLGVRDSWQTEIRPGRPLALALLPNKAAGFVMKCDMKSAKPGQTVKITLTQPAPHTYKDVIHIEVFGPDGKPIHYLSGNHVLADKTETLIPIALNQVPGKYKVVARQTIGTTTAKLFFTVETP